MNRKLVWNSIFFLTAVGVGIGLSAKPWQVYRMQRKQADIAADQMREAETERVDLTRKKAQYDSELGKEELARNEGYRQKDETPVESKFDGVGNDQSQTANTNGEKVPLPNDKNPH